MSETAETLAIHEPSAKYLGAAEPALVRGFELLANAPAGIHAVRKLITDLAIRGRLVAQGRSETSLCDVVAIETAKRQKRRFAAATEADSSFPLPQGWTAARLGDVFDMAYGAAMPEKLRRPGRVPVFGSNGVVGWHDEALVNEPALVIGRKGSVGAVNVSREPFWPIDTSFYVIPPPFFSLDFAFLVFTQLNLGRHDKATAIPGLNRTDAYAEVIGVPPLAEQHRIVARVEELMKLCDALEQNGRLADEQHARLTSTLFEALAASESAHALAENWQRVAEHFDLLLDRPEAVDALEQTILQLAVSGCLIPQRPDDAIYPSTAAAASSPEFPFDVPSNWQWTTLGDLCALVTSGSRSWKDYYATEGSTFIRSQDIKADRLEFDNRAFVKLPPTAEGLRTQVRRLDLLITITGANVGKAAVLHEALEEAYVSQHVALVRLHEPQMADFLHLWLVNAYGGRKLLLESSYGAKPGLNLKNIKDLPVPVPPLSEQHRIVARVEELRCLCADLRQRLTQARATQSRLADALVAEVT